MGKKFDNRNCQFEPKSNALTESLTLEKPDTTRLDMSLVSSRKKTFFFFQRGGRLLRIQAVACSRSSFECNSPTFCFIHALTEGKESLSVLCSWPLITPAASVFTPAAAERKRLWPRWMFTGVFRSVSLPSGGSNYKHSAHLILFCFFSAEPVIILTGIYFPQHFLYD